jgi:hypothetical protein
MKTPKIAAVKQLVLQDLLRAEGNYKAVIKGKKPYHMFKVVNDPRVVNSGSNRPKRDYSCIVQYERRISLYRLSN